MKFGKSLLLLLTGLSVSFLNRCSSPTHGLEYNFKKNKQYAHTELEAESKSLHRTTPYRTSIQEFWAKRASFLSKLKNHYAALPDTANHETLAEIADKAWEYHDAEAWGQHSSHVAVKSNNLQHVISDKTGEPLCMATLMNLQGNNKGDEDKLHFAYNLDKEGRRFYIESFIDMGSLETFGHAMCFSKYNTKMDEKLSGAEARTLVNKAIAAYQNDRIRSEELAIIEDIEKFVKRQKIENEDQITHWERLKFDLEQRAGYKMLSDLGIVIDDTSANKRFKALIELEKSVDIIPSEWYKLVSGKSNPKKPFGGELIVNEDLEDVAVWVKIINSTNNTRDADINFGISAADSLLNYLKSEIDSAPQIKAQIIATIDLFSNSKSFFEFVDYKGNPVTINGYSSDDESVPVSHKRFLTEVYNHGANDKGLVDNLVFITGYSAQKYEGVSGESEFLIDFKATYYFNKEVDLELEYNMLLDKPGNGNKDLRVQLAIPALTSEQQKRFVYNLIESAYQQNITQTQHTLADFKNKAMETQATKDHMRKIINILE